MPPAVPLDVSVAILPRQTVAPVAANVGLGLTTMVVVVLVWQPFILVMVRE